MADVLVVATGSQAGFPAKDEDVSTAASLSKYQAALATTQRADRIAIVGGGPVGVELAGEISFAYPGKDVTLFHAGARLLSSQSGLKPAVAERLADQLRAAGVTLHLNARVDLDALDSVARDEAKADAALPDDVTTGPVMVAAGNGAACEVDAVFRCTGARCNSTAYVSGWLAPAVEAPTGRLKVNQNLQVRCGGWGLRAQSAA